MGAMIGVVILQPFARSFTVVGLCSISTLKPRWKSLNQLGWKRRPSDAPINCRRRPISPAACAPKKGGFTYPVPGMMVAPRILTTSISTSRPGTGGQKGQNWQR